MRKILFSFAVISPLFAFASGESWLTFRLKDNSEIISCDGVFTMNDGKLTVATTGGLLVYSNGTIRLHSPKIVNAGVAAVPQIHSGEEGA